MAADLVSFIAGAVSTMVTGALTSFLNDRLAVKREERARVRLELEDQRKRCKNAYEYYSHFFDEQQRAAYGPNEHEIEDLHNSLSDAFGAEFAEHAVAATVSPFFRRVDVDRAQQAEVECQQAMRRQIEALERRLGLPSPVRLAPVRWDQSIVQASTVRPSSSSTAE